MGSETYSLRVHYRRTPRKLDPRQIPVTGGSMSIHGSISLMLFKLQKTEKGDFFEPFKKIRQVDVHQLVSLHSIASI